MISYKNAYARLYRTHDSRYQHEIESYHTRLPDRIVQGFSDGKRKKEKKAVQHVCEVVKSDCNNWIPDPVISSPFLSSKIQ